ncbi:hypothetical protein AJ80_03218 [Polytolypa hystricis UAMH7299]|uniref:Potassium channel tetramerisation-type BTB domain-containing protein n=1 Tax=Polytolypa hystricis (strain UAMH7299) TaxID=1447883 RepID=A0A2B7YLE0_POLH7|nr:hypothetical protein AJ80_03218 [Polytolypa hystricis UAMH7299]
MPGGREGTQIPGPGDALHPPPVTSSRSPSIDFTPFFTTADSAYDPSLGSFLDLVHLYESQGQLAHEHNDLVQSLNHHPLSLGPWGTDVSLPDISNPVLTADSSKPAATSLHHRQSHTSSPPSQASSSRDHRTESPAASQAHLPLPFPSPATDVSSRMPATSSNTRAPGGQNMPRAQDQNLSYNRSVHPSPTTASMSSTPGIARQSKSPNDRCILPPEKVFPIQIGSELFRLSGASIASDAPSYFSQFFEDQLRNSEDGAAMRTLYIDRDPITFQDILRHLQGYHVRPSDGHHFVKLFADAQFYSLPRLISQLFETEIFIQIGDRHFQIPRDIFSGPGDSPNFFSLGFAVFFASPGEVFPGLDRKGLLRPPSITPPMVINRSADVFADLLHMLRGYPIHIRNEEHRAELLRDCRYFHLRGLEQKLIPHNVSFNIQRHKSEIIIRLEDIRQSGVQFVSDVSPSDSAGGGGWVHYSRPFVDEASHELIVEIGEDSTSLDLGVMRADLHGLAKARVSSLFQVVANKMNLPTNQPLGLLMVSGGASSQSASPGRTPLSEDRVKIRIDSDADILLDGKSYVADWASFRVDHLNVRAVATPQGERSPFPPRHPAGNSSKVHTSSDSEMGEPSSAGAGSRASSVVGGHTGDWPRPESSASTQLAPHTLHPASGRAPSGSARGPSGQPAAKRKRRDSVDGMGEWMVRKGQWRLRVQANAQDRRGGGLEIVFVAVKLDAVSGQKGRNAQRGFLA